VVQHSYLYTRLAAPADAAAAAVDVYFNIAAKTAQGGRSQCTTPTQGQEKIEYTPSDWPLIGSTQSLRMFKMFTHSFKTTFRYSGNFF